MKGTIPVKPPVWFWVVSVIALLWNMIGVMAWLGTVFITEGMQAEMTPAQLKLLDKTPAWVTVAFAIAVFGGLLGCIGLFRKKRWSMYLFGISLTGILVQLAHAIFLSGTIQVYGQLQAMLMPFLVLAAGIALIFFTRHADKRRWLM